jgi:rhomboid family GlyGly-CTERM serine protease
MKYRASILYLGVPIVGTALLVGLGFDQHSAWAYQRTAISKGEYWRLISAHWVHLHVWHWLFNAAAWPMLYLLAGPKLSPMHWLLASFGCMIGVSAGLWFFSSAVDWYLGLSGILHGLLVITAWQCWSSERVLTSIGGLGLIGKLAWEQAGSMPSAADWIGHPVIVDAHLYGVCSGLVYVVIAEGWGRWRKSC